MTTNPILLQKNIVVLSDVLLNSRDFHWMWHWISFYHSQVYQLIQVMVFLICTAERCVFGRGIETGI